jgi:hypothetical protein
MGFDHGAGHPLLFLDSAKAPNGQKNNGFNDLGNYSEWPKVAGAVIQAQRCNGNDEAAHAAVAPKGATPQCHGSFTCTHRANCA